jgi:hypothetical protein
MVRRAQRLQSSGIKYGLCYFFLIMSRDYTLYATCTRLLCTMSVLIDERNLVIFYRPLCFIKCWCCMHCGMLHNVSDMSVMWSFYHNSWQLVWVGTRDWDGAGGTGPGERQGPCNADAAHFGQLQPTGFHRSTLQSEWGVYGGQSSCVYI